MLEIVNNSLIWPKCVPHLLSDNNSQIYLASCIICNREEYKSDGELTILAVTQLWYALRWIIIFEVGLIEQKVWPVFSGSGHGNTYEYIYDHFSDIPDINCLS